MKQIILASQSPRRKELLRQIGLDFQVRPSGIEEIITSSDPVEIVKALSRQKALDVAKKEGEDSLVIGADTIVVREGKIMGKPGDPEEACRMLWELQGGSHSVYTGVTLVFPEETFTFAEETGVRMFPMTEEEIRWYVSTGEPMDKAGAYGIQGLGARFIEGVRGDYHNVVGLPAARVYQELKKRGGME